jgi:hypothetical protein
MKTVTNTFIETANYTHPIIYSVSERGFDVAYSLWPPLAPEVGYHQAFHKTLIHTLNPVTGNVDETFNTTLLDVDYCGNGNFNYSDASEVTIKGIAKFFCIKDKSLLNLGGTY